MQEAAAGSHAVAPSLAAHPLTTERRDLIAAVLATVACSLPVFLVGTLAVEMRESLRFDAAALGVAIAAHYFGAAAFAVPLGWLADRYGAAVVMRISTRAIAVLLLALALVARSWVVLVVMLIPCGMANASTGTATNRFLVRRLPNGRQGRAFGIKQAAVPFASLLGGLAVPAIALTVGWRWAFVFAAAIAFAASLLIPSPRPDLAAIRTATRHAPAPRLALAPLLILSVALGLGVFAGNGLAAFLVTGAVAAGLGQGSAGVLAAVASAAAIAMRVATGYRADARGRSHFRTVATMLAVGSVGFFLLAEGSATQSHWLFIAGAIAALGIGWGWNGLFNFAVVHSHQHAPGRSSGITQVGGRLGGVAGPFVVGSVAAHGSYSLAWVILGCAGLLAAMGAIIGSRALQAH